MNWRYNGVGHGAQGAGQKIPGWRGFGFAELTEDGADLQSVPLLLGCNPDHSRSNK